MIIIKETAYHITEAFIHSQANHKCFDVQIGLGCPISPSILIDHTNRLIYVLEAMTCLAILKTALCLPVIQVGWDYSDTSHFLPFFNRDLLSVI